MAGIQDGPEQGNKHRKIRPFNVQFDFIFKNFVILTISGFTMIFICKQTIQITCN